MRRHDLLLFLLLILLILAGAWLPQGSGGALARPGGAIVLAFDDGCDSHLLAASALEARGVRGTFYVTSGDGFPDASCSRVLTPGEIQSLASRGHDIEAHTVTHPHLTTLSDDALRRELADSQARLRSLTGQSVLHMAYPFGETDARVKAVASEMYSSGRLFARARSVDPPLSAFVFDATDRFELPSLGIERSTTFLDAAKIIDLAKTRSATVILVFHDISSAPSEFDVTSQMLSQIVDYSVASGLPVLTLAKAMGDASFAPRGGNEWWVQTAVSGPDAARIVRVEARDDGGPWVTLALKSWGDYAASFRVEPGHSVRFRATLTDGRVVESCAFSHPTRSCATTAPPGPGFTATWRNARGNAWWVETDVSVTGDSLARVDARVNGGAWNGLSPRSYGSWAKSFAAPPGSTVEFRAISPSGVESLSTRIDWPPRP